MLNTYKRCPFIKSYCSKECALYDESMNECVFFRIKHFGQYLIDVEFAEERIITILQKLASSQEEEE